MADDTAPKSAYELAMERLKKQDADAGVERQAVTDEQRAAIAEIRNFYEAKLAELEVMHQSKMRASVDPEARAVLEQGYRRDRERLATERDAKVEKARRA
jgi:hypothetical protein